MKKEIKLTIFIVILLSIFLIFLYFLFRPYNYTEAYTINKFKIKEEYNKTNGTYIFNIKYNDIEYEFLKYNDYIFNKELVNDVKVGTNDNETCILPVSKDLEFYPLCSKDNKIYTYNLNTSNNEFYKIDKINYIDKEYKNIKINYLNDNSYLIYNYKGFYLINKDKVIDISLFNKDIYNLNITYQYDNYLLVPDYNSDYYFNKIYLINMKNGKVKEINIEYDLSFDIEFIGNIKNKIYLIDKKEKKEYCLNIKKETIDIIDYQVIKDKRLVKASYNELLEIVSEDIDSYYKIIDNYLYLVINNTNTLISSHLIDSIVKISDDTVYYLSEGNLYMFNPFKGEILLMSNFEWNFNYNNIIYIIK